MRHGSSDGRGGSAERPPGAATSHDRRSTTARGLSTASQDPDGAACRRPVDPVRRPPWSAGMTRPSVWPRLPTAAGQRGWGRRIGRPYREGSIRFPTARATGAWACASGIDRPGSGRSDPAPRRRIVDWPADAEQVLDALYLGKVRLLALSAAVPSAFAPAHALPCRVGRVAAAGAAPPPDVPWPWLPVPSALRFPSAASRTDLDGGVTAPDRPGPAVAAADGLAPAKAAGAARSCPPRPAAGAQDAGRDLRAGVRQGRLAGA